MLSEDFTALAVAGLGITVCLWAMKRVWNAPVKETDRERITRKLNEVSDKLAATCGSINTSLDSIEGVAERIKRKALTRRANQLGIGNGEAPIELTAGRGFRVVEKPIVEQSL